METKKTAPRYLSLADDLRTRIETGDLKAGDRLPSELELSSTYGFSRGTVVRAIEQLVTQGFVNRRQGSGSFVSTRSLHRRAGKLLSFSDTVREDGHRTEQRFLGFRDAEAAEAQEFGVSPPAMVLTRLRMIDGVPCAIHRSLIPQSVFNRLDKSSHGAGQGQEDGQFDFLQAPDFSLYALFEKSGFAVGEARERVTARLADSQEAALLEIVQPSAVIVVFRLSYSASHELVEAVEAVYRADYYTYDTHLIRGHMDSGSGLRVAATTDGFSKEQTTKPKEGI
ncbi:MAG: GntR family transcriptional regulator [Rhizobiaceae bacterium]|nr:GntR family transcriptional regulator [Rhizobiaceae bacterium]